MSLAAVSKVMTLPVQGQLFEDRLPQEFYDHYLIFNECLACRTPLNHEVHAYNHWKRCHKPKPKPRVASLRYFMWDGKRWRRVSNLTFVLAQMDGPSRRPVAIVKK